MMSKKLIDIADIRSGYSFRGKVTHSSNGNVRVVQAKDIAGLHIDTSSLPRVKNLFDAKHLLRSGDIVIGSRGRFNAALYSKNAQVVASSSLFIIRPKSEDILSNYLAIVLNQPASQAYIASQASGATIQSIRISDLEDLKIAVPSTEKQKQIIALHESVNQMQDLLQTKSTKLNQILSQATSQAIKGAA